MILLLPSDLAPAEDSNTARNMSSWNYVTMLLNLQLLKNNKELNTRSKQLTEVNS